MSIDILSAFKCDPPDLDFVLLGLLAGTVATLFFPGATGKSFFAVQAAMGVAGGLRRKAATCSNCSQGREAE